MFWWRTTSTSATLGPRELHSDEGQNFKTGLQRLCNSASECTNTIVHHSFAATVTGHGGTLR
jgi:hypothetical protein